MSDHMKLGLLFLVIFVLGVPLLGRLGEGSKPAAKTDAKAAAAPATKSAAKSAAPQALQPPKLNASNLANTTWNITIEGFPVTVTFLPGGAATANSPLVGTLQGSWSVNGSDLNVKAVAFGKEQSATVKISGDQILVEGKPAQRVK
jgi:hypothetical protein